MRPRPTPLFSRLVWLPCLTALVSLALLGRPTPAPCQQAPGAPSASSGADAGGQGDADTVAPTDVSVNPEAEDSDITSRLLRILEATEWFEAPTVRVEEGVVFLGGTAAQEEQKTWAGNLARNTQDVVAVVNRIKIATPSPLDLSLARSQLDRLVREGVRLLPSLIVVLIVLLLTWAAMRLAASIARYFATRRMQSPLLREIVIKVVALPVALLGIYFALRISSLTGLAATVLGGTGLIGLVVGIAFRDIAENFLASVLISVKRPFNMGDLILVEGHKGLVQGVSTRGTTLMTLEGNHVQIPNAVVYKSVIQNFTANPNIRLDFIVGIDYGDSIADAQQLMLEKIKSHQAVLAQPEPLVLVQELAASTINLQALFWINAESHSVLKVPSAVIRQVKQSLDNAGFTLPDESREVIFPKGVPVRMIDNSPHAPAGPDARPHRQSKGAEPERSAAEGDLMSDRKDIEQQAQQSRNPEQGENLIEAS